METLVDQEHRSPGMAAHDDIDHLREELALPAWPYVDFAARRECAAALARWPLLSEFDTMARRER